MDTAIKTVGSSGQISLGKQYAGRHVAVSETAPGVWVVKLGEFVPDTERWLHEPAVAESLDRASVWAERHPPAQSNIQDLVDQTGK
ncbi:MAG: hypothetical protein ACRESR_09680 [Gammaproteobacteria bacterium]